MLFTVAGKTYSVSYDKLLVADEPEEPLVFFVVTEPGRERVGFIRSRWQDERKVEPERSPLDESRTILEDIAKQLCDAPSLVEALMRQS